MGGSQGDEAAPGGAGGRVIPSSLDLTVAGSRLSFSPLPQLLPILFDGMASAKQWQTKEAALKILGTQVDRAPDQVQACLSEIVPKVSECMWDTRPTVITTATATMTKVCSVVGNRDLEAFLPIIVSCIAKPTEVPDCVHKLSATVFVQEVETPALAIMVPLLERGLRERQTAIKRKTALIIDNMCKLVEDPTAAAPFLPKLLPGLEKLAAEVADPECRTVCGKAQATLIQAAGGKQAAEVKLADEKVVLSVLEEQCAGKCETGDAVVMTFAYVASLCTFLSDRKCYSFDIWHKSACQPYLSAFVSADVAEAATRALLARCIQDTKVEKKVEEEDEEGEDLCNCEFSLAYGGKILLNNARLHLKRGRRYGLCGPNGAGKSTLMKAIANGQLEGFPPPDILKTVYVEHDIQGELADLSVLEYVFADPRLSGEPKEEVIRVLGSVGFTDSMQQAGVTSLSGGWKMKLALARAMLTRADIFLLDEVRYSAELTVQPGPLAPGVRVALPDACPAYAPLRSRDSPPTTWTSRTWPGSRTS
jgi:elongation factor 3